MDLYPERLSKLYNFIVVGQPASNTPACEYRQKLVHFGMKIARFIGIFLIVLIAGLAGMSCKKPAQTPTPYTALEFRVDSARLGATLSLSSVTLRVPAGWDAADSSLLEQARAASHEDTSRFRAEVSAVFLDPSSGAVLIARGHQRLAAQSFADWGRTLLERFRVVRPSWSIQEDWIMINAIPTLQIHAMDSVRVYFSFLLDRDPPLQLDYIVPAAAWESAMPGIESSLGTIQANVK